MKKVAIVILVLAAALAVAQTSLPTGTPLKMKLENTLTTYSSKPGDPFQARITEAVVVDGKTVIPVGATVEGRVIRTSEPRRIAGKPTIAILPEHIVLPNGERFMLNATLVDTSLRHGTDVNQEGQFKGSGHERRDTAEVGAGTGAGMLIGGLAGGGAGLVIGGAIGAGATVTHWLTKRHSAMIPVGTELFMELSRPMVMGPSSGQ
jgi:hypothetical protein